MDAQALNRRMGWEKGRPKGLPFFLLYAAWLDVSAPEYMRGITTIDDLRGFDSDLKKPIGSVDMSHVPVIMRWLILEGRGTWRLVNHIETVNGFATDNIYLMVNDPLDETLLILAHGDLIIPIDVNASVA